MFRTLLLLAVAAVIWLCVEANSVQARLFSVNNPYTSFNLSGVNYGSMKWEREHGNRRAVFSSSRRTFIRRR